MSSQEKNESDVRDAKNGIRREAMECVESGQFRQALEHGYVRSEVISYLVRLVRLGMTVKEE